jgi:predicted nucleic acid-binding protein
VATGSGGRSLLRLAFLDSNILIYAEDVSDVRKQEIAVNLIEAHARQRAAVLSTSVLGEYFRAVTRKLGIEAGVARDQVEFYSLFPVIMPTVADVLAAIDIHRLRRFSYWDSLNLRCAQSAGCGVLYTEDMHHGQVIDGVRIVNPFL